MSNISCLLKEVGCDFVLNSNLTNDFCGVCNGTNSTCEIIQNEIYFNYSKKKSLCFLFLISLVLFSFSFLIKLNLIKLKLDSGYNYL